MALRKSVTQAIAVLAFAAAPAFADNSRAETQHTIDPNTNIESWQIQDNGIEVTLIQIGSDQARAFFLARGFNRVDVDYYAASCVIATIVRNRSSSPISYHLANWQYEKGDGVTHKLKSKYDWLREWKQRGVSPNAQIAFEWSQHPAGQTLEPGDWNQGMTTYQVPYGSLFNLTVKWNEGKSNYVDTIKDIRCAY